MQKKVKLAAAAVVFSVLFCAVLTIADHVFERKYSYSKYADFYGQEEAFDVLFLGTSHMLLGELPMELWNDYGIVSYNLANSSETLCTNYWQLVNALKYTKPKVVVVDLYAIDGGGKVNTTYLHNFTDMLPFSMLKLRIVTDLLPKENWGEYLFEFSLYHSRWEELSGQDIMPVKTCAKGAELRYEKMENTPPVLIPKEEYDDNPREGKEYLQRLIDLCKKNDIDVILTYLPYSEPEGEQRVANAGYIIADRNQIPYINFLYEDMGGLSINYATDCADISSHLNVSGARKTTAYLGRYIADNYDVPDRRTDKAYEHWYNDYEEYRSFIAENLNGFDNIQSYLVGLNDSCLETTVYLSDNSSVYRDSEIMDLLGNINSLGKLSYGVVQDNIGENDIEIEARDIKTGEIVSRKRFSLSN